MMKNQQQKPANSIPLYLPRETKILDIHLFALSQGKRLRAIARRGKQK